MLAEYFEQVPNVDDVREASVNVVDGFSVLVFLELDQRVILTELCF